MSADKSDFAGKGQSVGRWPMVIHRWFANGGGWAWSKGQELAELTVRFSPVLRSRPATEEIGLLEGGPPWWFYHHAPDYKPLDPKAHGRHPSIFRAVALPSRPRAECREELARRLANTPLPERPGESSQLYLEVPWEWLEQFSEKDVAKLRAPADSPQAELAPPRKVVRRWLWRLLAMTALVASVAAIILVFVWPSNETAAAVSARDVGERLLCPFGVNLGDTASEDEVYQKFCQLYCKQGMLEHFFPGATLTEFDRAMQAAQEAARQPQKHPDVRFAERTVEPLGALGKAIQWLPGTPVISDNHNLTKARGQQDAIPEVINWLPNSLANVAGNRLTKAVNNVAKNVPERDRNIKGPDKSITSTNSVAVLEHAVVKPLLNAGVVGRLRRGEYERWFFEDFRWQPGEPFPWDEPPAKDERVDYRHLALLFLEKKRVPSDIESAAEQMHKWLSQRGVRGISKEDVRARPWFVGRCFVEFLSLKHVKLTDSERQRLDKENTLVWQQLSTLPADGWPAGEVGSDPRGAKVGMRQTGNTAEPWVEVRKRLEQLAKGLNVGATAYDAALVQRIVNAVENWLAQRSKLENQASEKLRKKQEKEKEIASLKQEIDQLSQKKTQLREDVKQLDEELPKYPPGDQRRAQHKDKMESKEREYKECENALNERKNRLTKAEEELNNLKQEVPQDRVETGNPQLDQLWKRLTNAQQQYSSGRASGEQ